MTAHASARPGPPRHRTAARADIACADVIHTDVIHADDIHTHVIRADNISTDTIRAVSFVQTPSTQDIFGRNASRRKASRRIASERKASGRLRRMLYPVSMTDAAAPPTAPQKPQALIVRRLLALFYDFWPMLAVWMLLSALFNLGYYLAGHDARDVLKTSSVLGVLLWLCCWLTAGAYAVLSWSHGGQTLGMRPWRLRVTAAEGRALTREALIKRYLVGTASLLLVGFGFWCAWFDRDRLTWHDRASGTRLMRVPKA